MPDDRIRPDRPNRRRVEDDDEYEDRPRRRRPRRDEVDDDDDSIRRNDGGLNTLIPYKNPKALTGYYLGVFSLIPCVGLLLGPAALVLGFLALRTRNANPKAGGTTHAIVALILGGLTTLVNWGCVAFVGLSALMKK